MNIYFDTEFEGLYKDAKLISLGMIAENGKSIYIEFKDIDTENLDAWVKDNVLSNTCLYGNANIYDIIDEDNYFTGNKEEIKGVLLHWLSQFDSVQLISDVCHYDMVLFIDIFGSAWDLPNNINPFCIDLNQEIMKTFWLDGKQAFDFNREEILDALDLKVVGKKHNSLYDAAVIKAIYEYCIQ